MSRADEPRMNHAITNAQVRLIDANGNMLGIVAIAEAIRKAQDAGLDLIEIVPNAEPPVCKILDYGKFKYEAQKKAHEARKKQKIVLVKEVMLRPTIDKHDLEIKMRNMLHFLAEGDKVKVTMRFRGREIDHVEIGWQVINKVKETLGEEVKYEVNPRQEGKQIMMVVAPK